MTPLQDLAAIHRQARQVARRIDPFAERMDEAAAYDPRVLALLGELLVLRSFLGPARAPTSLAAQCAWVEHLASVCGSTAVLVQSQGTVAHTLRLAGGPRPSSVVDQIRRGALAAWVLTEPEAGSDVLAMRTTATRDHGGWVINGVKRFITNAGLAEHYLVFARTASGRHGRAISAFLVRGDQPGVAVPRIERKLGLRASVTGDVELTDVRVPDDALVGDEGAGVQLVIETLRFSRPLIAAMSVGLTAAAYEIARTTCADQLVGDIPQDVTWKGHALAAMAIQLHSSRLVLADVAPTGRVAPETWRAAAAKAYCSDVAVQVAGTALDLVGPGEAGRPALERISRDARVLPIFEGANEIQRVTIARSLPSLAPGAEADGRVAVPA